MSSTGAREDRPRAVEQLYEEHLRADFPDRWCDELLAGVDLVLLDADLSGVVDTWLHNGERVDGIQRTVAGACLHDLDRVLPQLTDGHERQYGERLRDLARLLADG